MASRKNNHTQVHDKIGRNEPCPCGSGKKFKKCCLGRSNPALDKTNLTNNTQLQSTKEHLDKRVHEIIEDLNNTHSQVLSQMSRDEFFEIVNSVYADKRYEKYDFTETEMEEMVEKYGMPPHDEDEESINKTWEFSFKAAKEKYIEKEIVQAVMDHYLHMIDCYDQGEFKESWVLARCGEELIEYLETQGELPLFLFKKVLDGLNLHEATIMKKGEKIIDTMNIDLTSLKEKDGNIADFISDLSLTSEQEKKAEEYFERNPDVLREQEEMIDESIKHVVNMIFAGELRGLLLEQEDIEPVRDHILKLFVEQLPEEVITTMPQDQIKDITSKILMEVAAEWMPQLLDDSRWVSIVEVIKNEIEATGGEKQVDKKRSLLTALFLLESSDESWAKDYIGNAIILSSLKHQTNEDVLRS